MTGAGDVRSRNFSRSDFGSPERWGELVSSNPKLGDTKGKGFLGEQLGLNGMEISLNRLVPGGATPFSHAHKQNEELYLVISGVGEMMVDGERFALKPGTAVRVAPPGARKLRNTGDEAMSFLVVQAKAGSLEQATAADGILVQQADW